jgi:hypothetical protein
VRVVFALFLKNLDNDLLINHPSPETNKLFKILDEIFLMSRYFETAIAIKMEIVAN